MKIAIIADVHANLIALQAVINALKHHQPAAIYHLGDAISIGPYPAETLDLLLNTPNMHFIMGNHDWWFVDGLPQPQPDWMSAGEVAHQQWTHAQLDPALRETMAQWPFVLERRIAAMSLVFLHYGLRGGGSGFESIIKGATATDYDRMFNAYDADVICFGHTHKFTDLKGTARYINPGSVGCSHDNLARYTLLFCSEGYCNVYHDSVAYDQEAVLREFDARQVPERDFIRQAFFWDRK